MCRKDRFVIRLNGNVYLTEDEIDDIVHTTLNQFRTSHRAILPKKITYLDREFVDALKDEAKHAILSVYYLYGYGEKYAPVKKIIKAISDRFKEKDQCCEKVYFMQYDLTDTQRKKYRTHYENFLINTLLEECIQEFKKLS